MTNYNFLMFSLSGFIGLTLPAHRGGSASFYCKPRVSKTSTPLSEWHCGCSRDDKYGVDLGGVKKNVTSVWSMVEEIKMEKHPWREENIESSEAQHGTDDSEDGSSSESESEEQQRHKVQGSNSKTSKIKEPLAVTKPHRQLCRSPCLDRPSFSLSSTVQDLREDESGAAAGSKTASGKEYQSKMDFALKLGYSGEQVETVLKKLGAAALINDVLAELVRLGNKVEPEVQPCSSTAIAPISRSPCVKETVSPEVSVEEESVDTFDNLRPIVIDGSNVAMR